MEPVNDNIASGVGITVLRMSGIGKSFGGVVVLSGVPLELHSGEVHILAGENGAGKSTLIKIMAGVYPDYEGRMEMAGREARFRSPQEALAAGIAVIYQEISLVGTLSVADNIFLGRERSGPAGVLDRKSQAEKAREVLSGLGLDLDVSRPVEDYPVSVQQMIEIAKALSCNARVIVMDEPTSTLSAPEVERLFGLIQTLKQRGCAIVYITHKMEEIYRIADRITVLRDGRWVGCAPAVDLPEPELVRWMVGRELSSQFPPRQANQGDEVLSVEGLTLLNPVAKGRPLVDNLSFSVCAGEILGLAGLQGSGASEALGAVFGVYGTPAAGNVRLLGETLPLGSPLESIRRGLALLTNDRKANGFVQEMDITQNISLAALPRFSPGGWLRHTLERKAAMARAESLRLKASSLSQLAGTLSGGNQQKVILAKWLETGPRVLFLDEPTRGVDIGVKHEIYELMNRWTEQGMAVVLITSEMPELLAMSDRIIVLSRGKATAEFSRAGATQEKILQAAMGRACQEV